MSDVIVTPLNVAGGGNPPVTRFLDSFTRATLNTGVGNPVWQPVTVPISGVAPIAVPNNSCDGANMVLGCTGAINPGVFYPGFMPCLAFTYSLVNGQTQYVQCQFAGTSNASSADAGPAVFVTDNGNASGSAYVLNYDVATGNAAILKTVTTGLVQTNTQLGANVAIIATDVVRLSVQVGVPNTLRLSKNGVVQVTTTDAALSTGVPGFANVVELIQAGGPAGIKFTNFDGGLGL